MTHINDLNDVFKSVSLILKNNGVLIIEDPSLLECLKKASYDQFYNEHIYIFSALSVNKIINKFGLELFDIEKLNTHGGSLRYYIKRKVNNKIKISINVKKQLDLEINFGLGKYKTYQKFSETVAKSRKNLIRIVKELKSKKQKIIGYGATAKACTILNYCNFDNKIRYIPGTNIKILKYNKKLLNKVNYIFLGAWNFKSEILKKEKLFIKKGGKFITHVPSPKIF